MLTVLVGVISVIYMGERNVSFHISLISPLISPLRGMRMRERERERKGGKEGKEGEAKGISSFNFDWVN